ncbi:hypothetical protein BCR33DRAFT_769950 [Rhizoclosmatium globosum]|uniref:Peptidase S28 n=1 Tax=Rhizoclosmatium globosum TaxID=329046 RepID=A0A1Y2BQL6_9FUNG|nr:hypothetical protein BCR33DRAFT_769950 [Rhizoclosmatium globosum]|eukprot:ORY37023.1 hypothetical protein BCR33DRAFT_769950 [Rhizoclosmatium globosum]
MAICTQSLLFDASHFSPDGNAATTVSAASVAVKQQLTPHLRPLNIVDAIGQGNLPAAIAPPGLPTKQDAYYKPGGPIFFFIAGESQADDGFMTGGAGSLLSWLMPRYNGMASVEDMAEFISNFPSLFPQYKINAATRWIAIGGSYPELVYAAHASSAPVNLVEDFWQYSYAVDQGMTFESNMRFGNGNACMTGWTRAVKLFDDAITANLNNPAGLKAFKSKFWLSQVENVGDVASFVTSFMGGGVQYFETASTIGDKTTLETVCGGKLYPAFTKPKATDAELLTALQDLTIYRMKLYGVKGDSDPIVGPWFSTTPITDWSLTGPTFQSLWPYQSCNQFGYFQVGQHGKGSLIEGWPYCSEGKYSRAGTKEQTYWGGLNIEQDKILWVNGQYDPWHWLSNYNVAYDGQESMLYANATHCNDLWGPTTRWPAVSPSYSKTFWDKIFATYDKWILG